LTDDFEKTIIDVAEQVQDDPERFVKLLETSFVEISPSEKGKFLLATGITTYNHSHYTLALASMQHALKYFEERNDIPGQSICYNNIGNIYQSLGQYQKALEQFEKALVIAKEIGDKGGESTCYANIGNIYQSLDQYQKALEYQERALTIFKEIGNRNGESTSYERRSE
jgi:tetratricopeptide (TPR) repeat protein